MKKLITLALIISATTFIQAQSNLVFNQVILLELSNGLETTVPEGKVWKVTYGQGGTIFKVNGENWTVGVLGSHKNTPIWFPAESVFTKYIGSNSINVLNILEFNVVAISSGGGGSGGGGVSSDGFAAIGIVDIEFNDTTAGTSNHLMGTITVPEGEIWKITDVSILHSNVPFGSSTGGGNYLVTRATYTFIGTHQFIGDYTSNRTARYLAEGSYEVRSWEANGLNPSSGNPTEYYQAKINGIKYSAN